MVEDLPLWSFMQTIHEFPMKSLICVFAFGKQRLNPPILHISAPSHLWPLPSFALRSGGFLEHIFKEAARELLGALELYPSSLVEFNPIVALRFAIDLTSPLTLQTKQNEDMREADKTLGCWVS